MAATDDKTNFYVMDAAIDSLADNINGGTMYTGNGQTYVDGRPAETYSNVDAVSLGGSEYTLENKDNGGWGTTDVDDQICWDTAGTVEFVRVLELDYGSDSDVIRFYAVSDATITVATGKSVYVGGAWKTIDFPCGMVDNTWTNAAGDPITIWVKGGAYNELATLGSAATGTSPITLEGYDATEGDGFLSAFADLPKMDGGGSIAAGIKSNLGNAYWLFKNIWVNDSTQDGFDMNGGSNFIQFIHIKSSNNGAFGIYANDHFSVLFSEISGNASHGISGDYDVGVLCSEIYGNGGHGADINTGLVFNNIIRDNTSSNIFSLVPEIWALCNTIDGVYADNNSSIGINISNGTTPATSVVMYNIVHDCNIALSASVETPLYSSFYNQWDNNNSANVNWIEGKGDIGRGSVTVTGEYENLAGNDYQPTAVSPANGAAGPTTMPAGLTTTNRAVGAAEPATASGTTVIVSHRKVR